MNTLANIEQALNNHSLWMRVANDKYWLCRRNGNTKRWKRDTDRFAIPLKCGLYVYNTITNDSDVGEWYNTRAFIICEFNPNDRIAETRKAWGKHKAALWLEAASLTK
jgi:hypothetical protein